MHYSTIFNNGTNIQTYTFDDAKAIPYAEYIIRTTQLSKSSDRYFSSKNEIMDENGNPKNLKIGNFELINISNDVSNWNQFYQNLTFYDLKNKIPFTIQSHGNFVSTFYDSVISFMAKLNELGSYKAYENSLKIDELEKKLDKANERIKTKEEEIEKLEEELRLLKDG